MSCDHETLSFSSQLDSWNGPPYDGTDERWRWWCAACGADLAEGDGYQTPPTEAEVRGMIEQTKTRRAESTVAKPKSESGEQNK